MALNKKSGGKQKDDCGNWGGSMWSILLNDIAILLPRENLINQIKTKVAPLLQ